LKWRSHVWMVIQFFVKCIPVHTFFPKLTISSNFYNFRDNHGYFIHMNHAILKECFMFLLRIANHSLWVLMVQISNARRPTWYDIIQNRWRVVGEHSQILHYYAASTPHILPHQYTTYLVAKKCSQTLTIISHAPGQ